ncbi:hypothetical protein [Alteromonas flava]|uniref:hypothetical protein n=1 Tax=Alteromonas flava TaxID=2048003 RepID=UPI000C28B77E|nr:hypothetical protein [Alteromonas flava]
MSGIHSILFVIHILTGTAALILFWIPMCSKKGQLNHVTYGRFYVNTMYAVAASGALMAIMVLVAPMTIKADIILNARDPAAAITSIRIFWSFLLYLSLLSFVTTRHGVAVLKVRQNRELLRRWHYLLPLVALVIVGTVFAITGFIGSRHLHTLFGFFGCVLGYGLLRYCLKTQLNKGEWVLEHIGTIIGSAIGAYTAFLAFGGRVIFAELGQWQLAFWIAPGVIGGIAANMITKKYAVKLGLHHAKPIS